MAAENSTITLSILREHLHYDAGSGRFFWTKNTGRAKAGSVAGCLDRYGYVRIGLRGRVYRAHRLAFLWMTGSLPSGEIDHINRIKDDNRWPNLRVVDHHENLNNRRGKGWYFDRRQPKPYIARIYVDGRSKHLGCFSSQQEAEAAYLAAKAEDHPEYQVGNGG